MAKFVKFPAETGNPIPEENTSEGQMLRYLRNKYNENPVDQFDLMLELNTHQMDTEVLKERSMRPLSQLFGFYIPDWVKKGYAERITAKVLSPAAQPGKLARMLAHIDDLEAKLKAAGIDFHPFVYDTPKEDAQDRSDTQDAA